MCLIYTSTSIFMISSLDSWMCALTRIIFSRASRFPFGRSFLQTRRCTCRGTYHETQPIVLCTPVTISCFSACDTEADHVMKEEVNTPEMPAISEACNPDSDSEPHLSAPAVQEAAKAGGTSDTCPPSHPLSKNPPKVNIGTFFFS